jgi:hypothetical protein
MAGQVEVGRKEQANQTQVKAWGYSHLQCSTRVQLWLHSGIYLSPFEGIKFLFCVVFNTHAWASPTVLMVYVVPEYQYFFI